MTKLDTRDVFSDATSPDTAGPHTAGTGAVGDRPVWPALRHGWRRRCPCCGQGTLYHGYLTLRQECPVCDTDLSHARADDGPAYLTILIVAKVMGTLMLKVFLAWQPDPYLMASMFCIGAAAMALYLLPRLKGVIVGIQWSKRMHGF